MLGAIIGDIVGSAYEFNRTNDYNFELFPEESGFTDDTICTIAIADAILRDKDFGESLHQWCRRYPNPKGGYGGRFRQWVMSENPKPYNSFGNGSAMRVSPIAWAFPNLGEALPKAAMSAECTHNHPEGIKGAEAVVMAIHYGNELRRLSPQPDKKAILEKFKFIADYANYNLDIRRQDVLNRFDETCQGTVPVALWIISQSSGFEDAIRRTVSLGADADTLGAIVGSIAEAIWGLPQDLASDAMVRLPPEMKGVVLHFYHKYNWEDCPLQGYGDEGAAEDLMAEEGILTRMRSEKKQRRIAMTQGALEYMTCRVHGTEYIDDQHLFYMFEENDILTLHQEEENEYDSNAIALYFEHKKIGYVPRTQNRELAQLLKNGWDKAFIAYVSAWNGCGKKRSIYVKIMVKPNRLSSSFAFDEEAYRAYNSAERAQLYYSYGGNTGMLPGRVAPDKITHLRKDEVFVFGSNKEGHHAGGAARAAREKFGAIWGQGDGLQGSSYAISTMEGLIETARNVDRFILFAAEHQELKFFVTPIGCGIAGYTPLQIAPLFIKALPLPNVYLPKIFWEYYWQLNDYCPDCFKPSDDWNKWDK